MAFTKLAQDRPRILIVGGGYVGFTVAKKIQEGGQSNRWGGDHC